MGMFTYVASDFVTCEYIVRQYIRAAEFIVLPVREYGGGRDEWSFFSSGNDQSNYIPYVGKL